MVLKLMFLFCLIPIIWEDLKRREISLTWFLLLGMVTVLLDVFQPIPGFWKQIIMNFFFILVQLFILSCYFSLKDKRWVWITSQGLGSGDIFFLVMAMLFLPFLSFLSFYLFSLLWTLLLTALFTLFTKIKIVKLPLAGLQALFLAILIVFSLVIEVDIRSEDWLLNYLNLGWMYSL